MSVFRSSFACISVLLSAVPLASALQGRVAGHNPEPTQLVEMHADGFIGSRSYNWFRSHRREEEEELAATRAWNVEHPQLHKPFFWFCGRVARMESDTSLLQDAPALVPPSTQRYNLVKGTGKKSYSQWKQDLILKPLLGPIKNGFFVESGASDGETDSNTLLYELQGWTGLLVEPDPQAFAKLMTKHRHAYIYHGCLSPTRSPELMHFSVANLGLSKVSDGGTFTVNAQPLHSLLSATGRSTVDFWSLDIEGSEAAVLNSTDFSKIEVGILMIEMNKNSENNRRIWEVMKKEGFHDIGHSNYDEGVLDHIFVNPKYFQRRSLAVPTREILQVQYQD